MTRLPCMVEVDRIDLAGKRKYVYETLKLISR
jgi:hypothetical protein